MAGLGFTIYSPGSPPRRASGKCCSYRETHLRPHLALLPLLLSSLQLLQQGANIHHQNRRADGGSALHEAVAHSHEAVVDLLMRHGANPLVENMRGAVWRPAGWQLGVCM